MNVGEQNPDEPPKAFFVLRIGFLGSANQCYTDDPESVASFMWGRQLSEYVLWVNNRIYNWPKIPLVDDIEEYLKYALDMDNALYPPEEFPRYHWWE